MKKNISFILILIMIFSLVAAGCSVKTDEDVSVNLDKVKQRGYFVVGLDDTFPPMGFKDEKNNIVGFDIDMAKAVAEKWGVEVRFKPVVWDTIIGELDNGNIDMVWNGMTITPEREEKVLFTKPYMENVQAIVIAPDSDITKKEDLIGKKVGYQAGSSAKTQFSKATEIFNGAEKSEYEKNDQALVDLELGRLDAVIMDVIVARYYLTKKSDTFKIIDDNFGNEFYGVAVRKSDSEFLNELQKAIDAIKADGTAAKISNEWFGEDVVL